MKAHIFGAGASAGTLNCSSARPPVARAFGSVLSARYPAWEREWPGLARVVEHLGRPIEQLGLEPIWTCIDYYAKLGPLLPSWPQWEPAATWDLKRALLQLYGRECDEAASQLPRSTNYTLGLLLNDLQADDLLISFNYDTVVERVASTFGLVLVNPDRSPREGVRIAKPHGSVSWCMNWETKQVEWQRDNGTIRSAPMDPVSVSQNKEPLLLGAVPIKSELIREVQQRDFPDVWTVVAAQWRLLTRAVAGADSITVVGYGFPPEDGYGRFLLREAMRARRGRPLAIEYFELPERALETEASIRDAFGRTELQPMWRGPVAHPAG